VKDSLHGVFGILSQFEDVRVFGEERGEVDGSAVKL